MSDFDVVSKPSHYARGGIEFKDAMKVMMDGVSVPPYVAGWWMQAVQYLWRWPSKNGIQDLKKAREVIGLMIDSLGYDKDGSYDTDDFDTEPPIVSSETELVLTDKGGATLD